MAKKLLAILAASITGAILLVSCAESEVPTVPVAPTATPQLSETIPLPSPTATSRAIVKFPTPTPLPSPTSVPTSTSEPTSIAQIEGEYLVEIIRVMDGDTLEVEIDEIQVAGLKVQTVRIFGIDTPETRTTDAFEKACGNWAKTRANDFVSSDGQYILLTKFEDGGFSRILGDIRSPDGVVLSEFMLDEGLAVEYEGGTRDFEDHRANCERLVEAGHIVSSGTSPSPTPTEIPTATPVPSSEPAPTEKPTVAPVGDTAPSPTATSTEEPAVTAEVDDSAVTYETCEEAEAAGLERELGTDGPGWGFPVKIVTGERDGDGDGFVCEETGPSTTTPPIEDTTESTPTASPTVEPEVTPTATVTPTETPAVDPQEVYESCDAAVEAGLERVKGDSGDGRGFPALQVPSAGDGDGDGVVCEK